MFLETFLEYRTEQNPDSLHVEFSESECKHLSYEISEKEYSQLAPAPGATVVSRRVLDDGMSMLCFDIFSAMNFALMFALQAETNGLDVNMCVDILEVRPATQTEYDAWQNR